LSDIYSNRPSRPITSATLIRGPFRDRYQQSPAGDLSEKVIHTLRRNIDSYVRRIIFSFKICKKISLFRVLNHGIIIIQLFVIQMDMLMMMNYLNVVVDSRKIRKKISKY